MKIKDGCEASTDDFYYDLFQGGYIRPKEILENEEDIKKVEEALKVIEMFKESCENQIEDFYC